MSDEVTPTTAQPEVPPTPAGDATPPAAAQTLTQADVDRIVKERLAREKAKYADYDTLKQAAAKLKELEDAQLSEADKTKKQVAELQATLAQEKAKARESAIRAAVITEASKLGFNDPNDAYKLLDLAALNVAEDGKIEGVAEAVKKLAEERKYLIKSAGGQPLEPFAPSGPGGPVRETDAQKHARLFGGQPFDSIDPTQHGGGVVIRSKGGTPSN